MGLHTRSVPSSPPVTTALPSGVNMPHVTPPSWPANTCMHAALPADTDHIHAVPSAQPASSTSPLGCHRSHSTSPAGPSSSCSGAGDGASPPAVAVVAAPAAAAAPAASHTRTTESKLPVATNRPVKLNATAATVSRHRSTAIVRSDARSKRRAVSSPEPVHTSRPVASTSKQYTELLCPRYARTLVSGPLGSFGPLSEEPSSLPASSSNVSSASSPSTPARGGGGAVLSGGLRRQQGNPTRPTRSAPLRCVLRCTHPRRGRWHRHRRGSAPPRRRWRHPSKK